MKLILFTCRLIVIFVYKSSPFRSNLGWGAVRILIFKSPGSPSICGSPSATNRVSCPSTIPVSISTSKTRSSLTNFTFGHSSHTCCSMNENWKFLHTERNRNAILCLPFVASFEICLDPNSVWPFPVDNCISVCPTPVSILVCFWWSILDCRKLMDYIMDWSIDYFHVQLMALTSTKFPV